MGAPGKPNPVSRENGKKGGRPVATPTLIKQEFRKALAQKINGEAEEWLTAISDAAKGHFIEIKQADGTVKVYRKAPNPQAWEKAMDRAFGKPDQSIDHTSGGKPLNALAELPPEKRAIVEQMFEEEKRKQLTEAKPE